MENISSTVTLQENLFRKKYTCWRSNTLFKIFCYIKIMELAKITFNKRLPNNKIWQKIKYSKTNKNTKIWSFSLYRIALIYRSPHENESIIIHRKILLHNNENQITIDKKPPQKSMISKNASKGKFAINLSGLLVSKGYMAPV